MVRRMTISEATWRARVTPFALRSIDAGPVAPYRTMADQSPMLSTCERPFQYLEPLRMTVSAVCAARFSLVMTGAFRIACCDCS
jgi:hypothetical protein